MLQKSAKKSMLQEKTAKNPYYRKKALKNPIWSGGEPVEDTSHEQSKHKRHFFCLNQHEGNW